jgi:hypothetical protein
MSTLNKTLFLFIFANLIPTCAGQSPQPRFLITISTPQAVVRSGGEVKVKIALKNISDHEISVSRSIGEDQGELHNDILVTDEHAKLLTKKKATTSDPNFVIVDSTIFVRLRPGDVFKDGIIVSNSHDVTKPGKYTIQVERLDDESKILVKSNTIIVTVTP